MSDFLDRAVSRGLGIARVVHRRREPVFAETAPERHIDRDGIAEITEVEEEAHVRPQPRVRSLPELPELRAADALGPDEAAPPRRRSEAADLEPVFEVASSAPGASRLSPNNGVSTTDQPRAQSQDVPLQRNAATAPPQRVVVESKIGARNARSDVASRLRQESAEDRPMDEVGQARNDSREGKANKSSGDAAFAASADAQAEPSVDAHRLLERSRHESRALVEYSDERSRDVDEDVTFPIRRRERPQDVFDAAPGTRTRAANARRVDDELTINVSIGSIEVARPQPPPPPIAVPTPRSARPSLDDYLQLRAKIRGR